jgi:hypothetical protein
MNPMRLVAKDTAMTKLKSQSHQGRPIEFSIDENGRLGIEFDDYPCPYRYMDEAKARELRDWLNQALPVEPREEPLPPGCIRVVVCAGCGQHDTMGAYHLDMCPAFSGPIRPKSA